MKELNRVMEYLMGMFGKCNVENRYLLGYDWYLEGWKTCLEVKKKEGLL